RGFLASRATSSSSTAAGSLSRTAATAWMPPTQSAAGISAALAARGGPPGHFALLDEAEIDLAVLQAGTQDQHRHAVTQAEGPPAALAGKHLSYRIEVVIVVRQLRDVHQAIDARLVQLHEQAEAGDAADRALEGAADVLLHPGTLV